MQLWQCAIDMKKVIGRVYMQIRTRRVKWHADHMRSQRDSTLNLIAIQATEEQNNDLLEKYVRTLPPQISRQRRHPLREFQHPSRA